MMDALGILLGVNMTPLQGGNSNLDDICVSATKNITEPSNPDPMDGLQEGNCKKAKLPTDTKKRGSDNGKMDVELTDVQLKVSKEYLISMEWIFKHGSYLQTFYIKYCLLIASLPVVI